MERKTSENPYSALTLWLLSPYCGLVTVFSGSECWLAPMPAAGQAAEWAARVCRDLGFRLNQT